MNVSKGTIIRTVLLVLTIINSMLALLGKSPLPISDEQLNEFVSLILLFATSIISWWKNNSFTKKAIEADELIKYQKGV